MDTRVLAIVVAYRPDPDALRRLLEALAPQVSGGVVVNNGVFLPLAEDALHSLGFELRHMGMNLGVASALNAGLRWAEVLNPDFVITFDQDSEPAANMVEHLLNAHRELTAKGIRVGAVGPRQVDRRSGKHAVFLAPIRLSRHKLQAEQNAIVEVDHLITSGCLFPTTAWRDAGNFLDDLFIDYVDIEWCLRLRSHGWHLFGVGAAVLNHSIGDSVLQWCGYQVFEHSPLRHYFLMRNGVHMQKLRHIALGWKIADGFQLLKKLIFFSLVGSNRWYHCKAMVLGIRDGLLGRLGPRM